MELYFEKTGTGKPLILLHGNGESCEIFRPAVEKLKSRFTVYAVDSRGHGKSPGAEKLNYEDMMEDVHQLIVSQKLEKPIVYGFSDGGIIALLLAAKYPQLLSRMVVSGVNANPRGLKKRWYYLFKAYNLFQSSPLFELMLTQPHITDEMLRSIQIPTVVLAGEKDMIRRSHMQHIAEVIPLGKYRELAGESHGSYVVNNPKIADIILEQQY